MGSETSDLRKHGELNPSYPHTRVTALTTRSRLNALLEGSEHRRILHEPTFTAEQAASIRSTPLECGGKSLVFKLGKTFAVLVVGGADRADNRRIRKAFGIQRLRFARREELLELTGLEPGCVPPFGRPVFDLPVYVDRRVLTRPWIAFSLADHGESAVMRPDVWQRLARPDGVYDLVG